MREIAAYAAARGIKPSTVLQISVGLGGTVWGKWEDGSASCSMRTAERIRQYMTDNPPQSVVEPDHSQPMDPAA